MKNPPWPSRRGPDTDHTVFATSDLRKGVAPPPIRAASNPDAATSPEKDTPLSALAMGPPVSPLRAPDSPLKPVLDPRITPPATVTFIPGIEALGTPAVMRVAIPIRAAPLHRRVPVGTKRGPADDRPNRPNRRLHTGRYTAEMSSRRRPASAPPPPDSTAHPPPTFIRLFEPHSPGLLSPFCPSHRGASSAA